MQELSKNESLCHWTDRSSYRTHWSCYTACRSCEKTNRSRFL